MMRRTLAITVLLIVGLSAPASAQLPDFSGTWILDLEGSTIRTPYGLAGLGTHAPERLYVQQNRAGTLILSSRLPGSQPRSYELEGQTWLQAMAGDPGKVLLTSRVRGLMLVTTGTGRVAGENITIQEFLRIGTDGQTLTLQTTTTLPTGAETNVLLYRRAGGL